MKRPLGLKRPSMILTLMLVTSFISVIFIASPPKTSAQTSLSQCNGTDNAGGQAVECHYTVTNNLDGNVTNSTITLEECHGAANDPATLVCTSSTTSSTDLVTSIDQCNGSGSGGGGTVACTVEVINNITGTVTPTTATVNQCNSSGRGGGTAPTVVCDPFPANTSGATVTQCNGSGNGGGGTARVQCTVDSGSTTTSVLTVTVNQCDGSGNGGGATVTCRTSLTNIVTEPAPSPSPSPTPTPGSGGDGSGGDGSGGDGSGGDGSGGDGSGGDGSGGDGSGGDGSGGDGSGGDGSGGDGSGGDGDGTTGQVSRVPVGGAAAGNGSTSGVENTKLLLLGFILVCVAGPPLALRRRIRVKA